MGPGMGILAAMAVMMIMMMPVIMAMMMAVPVVMMSRTHITFRMGMGEAMGMGVFMRLMTDPGRKGLQHCPSRRL